MNVPPDQLLAQDDWVIGGWEDIFADRENTRKQAEQKRKMDSRKASRPGRPRLRR